MSNLIHLNISLNDQEQVKLIFEKLPNLEILNEKNIKEELNQNENEKEIDENNIDNQINDNIEKENENDIENDNNNDNTNIIDLNDQEIKNISLQNEIPNFNDIYKKISQKFKSIQKNNFKDEFQVLIKNEIN